MKKTQISVGGPAPWFECRSDVNPSFHFDTVAGRYIILCFFGSLSHEISRNTLSAFLSSKGTLDERECRFFGVSVDPRDEALGDTVTKSLGVSFWDFDRKVSSLYGVHSLDGSGKPIIAPQTFVLDERLRIVAIVPFDTAVERHIEAVLMALRSLPQVLPPMRARVPAPILVVPRVFEPELCAVLMQYYIQRGGEESGFMREVAGKTVTVHDYGHKRRRDQEIVDENLRNLCMYRIHDRLVPEIQKAFQFRATRIERYIVACYESSTGGHFRPHRDNTTKGTAHRRFAVSLNLNTGDYQGGELCFPEFGQQRYSAPAGSAIVFSCSLLHEATPVRSGKRFVFLPFLYDEEAASLRKENLRFIEHSQLKV